jgi:hypothetical protein
MKDHQVLLSLIGSVLGSGIVVGLIQVFVSHTFSKKLSQFSTTLSGELFERQTKFAWLHTERSKALVTLYSLLSTVNAAFTVMLMPVQTGDAESRKTKIKQASDAIVEFFRFCSQNAVFFDDDLGQKLFQLDEQYRIVWSTYVPNYELLPTGREWAEAWEKLGRDVAPIQKQVQDKVRNMLGADVFESRLLSGVKPTR